MIIKAYDVPLSFICVDGFNCLVIKSTERGVLYADYTEQHLVERANCVASQSIINIASVLQLDDKRTGV